MLCREEIMRFYYYNIAVGDEGPASPVLAYGKKEAVWVAKSNPQEGRYESEKYLDFFIEIEAESEERAASLALLNLAGDVVGSRIFVC
jgi:hypothetical protein